MSARVLFVGDLHLGRRPRLKQDTLDAHALRVHDLTPAAAWRATVDAALDRAVDAVVLAGDVVECLDDRFAALAPLRAGVERLVAGGIRVVGVAGNHDGTALPRLAALVPGFTLLGRGGRWEITTIAGGVRLLGWSFPGPRHAASPLDAGLPPLMPGPPLLGVLHADLDARPASPYAPVARAALDAVPVAGWFLGHVHRPSLDPAAQKPIGYLGSLVGLDPSETGVHGPWLATVDDSGLRGLEQWPLAPLRWETGTVEASALPDGLPPEEALFAALDAGLLAIHARVGTTASRAVACTLRLTGRTPRRREIAAALPAVARFAGRAIDGTAYLVHAVTDELRPALDLESLAAGNDPAAILARLLRDLEAGGDDARAIVAEAGRRAELELASRGEWGLLDAAEPLDAAALLRAEAERTLEELLGNAP